MAKTNKIQPFGGKILVKRTEENEVKMGGIIIPDTAKEKPQQGEIIAVSKMPCDEKGNSKTFDPCLKPGDKVLFGKYAGTEIEFEGEDYIIMDQTDILAIIN